MAGEIIQIPLSNSFRFVLQAPSSLVVDGDPDYQLLADQDYPGVYGDCYSQKVAIGDVRTVQVRSNYTANSMQLYDASDDSPVGAAVPLIKRIGLISTGEADYDIWEQDYDFTGVPAGEYYLLLTGTGPDFDDYTAKTEPISVKATHPGTVLVEYYNFDNAFISDWRTGMTHKMRVEGRLHKQMNPTNTKAKLNDLQQLVKLKSVMLRQRMLETFVLPPYLHEKLTLILEHDVAIINGVRYTGAEPYQYEMEDDDLLCHGSAVVQQYDFYQVNRHDSNVRALLLAEPADLEAVAVSGSQIDLTWTNGSAEYDNVQVFRGDNPGGPYTLIATLAGSAESYSDDDGGGGLDSDALYYYVVRGLGGSEPTLYSNEAAARTLSFSLYTDGVNDFAENTTDALNLGDGNSSNNFSVRTWAALDGLAALPGDVGSVLAGFTSSSTSFAFQLRGIGLADYGVRLFLKQSGRESSGGASNFNLETLNLGDKVFSGVNKITNDCTLWEGIIAKTVIDKRALIPDALNQLLSTDVISINQGFNVGRSGGGGYYNGRSNKIMLFQPCLTSDQDDWLFNGGLGNNPTTAEAKAAGIGVAGIDTIGVGGITTLLLRYWPLNAKVLNAGSYYLGESVTGTPLYGKATNYADPNDILQLL